MKKKNKHQVMWNLCLPLALPDRAAKSCGNSWLPQHKIDISSMYHLMPSFGTAKITFFNKISAEGNTVPTVMHNYSPRGEKSAQKFVYS